MTERIEIHNRNGMTIVVALDLVPSRRGLAFVGHGLGGFKEQPHIETFARAFQECGYTTVRWDSTHSIGESDGKYEDATLTNYYHDFEDVIGWASTQAWYQEPFIVCGHSLGAISAALFAEAHPEKVKGLAPISTVVSGQLSLKASDPEETRRWKETGIKEEMSHSKPGVLKRLKWSHVEDRQNYDLLPKAAHLLMSVLMMVGDQDTLTPPDQQRILYEAIPHDRKEFHLIKGAQHTFRDSEHLNEIKKIIVSWTRSLDDVRPWARGV